MRTLGVGFLYDKKISVQKSHPYRVGGLFRHLGPNQNFQNPRFRLFGHPSNNWRESAPFKESCVKFKSQALASFPQGVNPCQTTLLL